MWTRTTRWPMVVAVVLVGLLISGCSIVFGVVIGDDPDVETEIYGDAWVVVIDDLTNGSAMEHMTALESTEYLADEALAGAGLGVIDGNEVGKDGYELYFNGRDAAAMWKVLEPVLAQAPVSWDRVELRDGLDDPNPTVIRR